MANREFKPLAGTLDSNVVLLSGFLSLASDASVNAANSKSNAGVFTKTGTGTYSFVLRDAYASILNVQLTMLKAATSAISCELTGVVTQNGVTTARTINIRTVDRKCGLAADVAANTGIEILVVAKNSGLRN